MIANCYTVPLQRNEVRQWPMTPIAVSSVAVDRATKPVDVAPADVTIDCLGVVNSRASANDGVTVPLLQLNDLIVRRPHDAVEEGGVVGDLALQGSVCRVLMMVFMFGGTRGRRAQSRKLQSGRSPTASPWHPSVDRFRFEFAQLAKRVERKLSPKALWSEKESNSAERPTIHQIVGQKVVALVFVRIVRTAATADRVHRHLHVDAQPWSITKGELLG